MRGVIFGAASGLVLSGVVLGAVSLIAPQPAGNRPPEAPATEVPLPAPEAVPEAEADAAMTPLADMAAPDATLPDLTTPGDSGTPEADTQPPLTPEIEADAAALAAPDAPDAGAALPLTPGSEAQTARGAQHPAPGQPALEEAPETGGLAALVNPDVGEAPELGAPGMAEQAPGAAVADDSIPAMVTAPDPLTPAAAPENDSPEADPLSPPQAALDPAVPATPDEGAAPALADTAAGDTQAAELPPLTPAAPEDSAPEVAADTPAHESAPAPVFALQGDTSLPGGSNGVVIRRPGGDDEPAGIPDEIDATPDLPPIWQAATGFANPDDLPLVAVVLIDDGLLELGPEVVATLPFPATIALDPLAPDAAATAANYRAAGIETAVLARFPDGASATDAIVSLGASFATLPGAVALVDVDEGGTQGSRDLAEAALGWLGPEGRGLAWLPGGGDPVARLATGAEAPARPILRDLDGAGQDPTTIRRFLDNAPMRARQDGAVILLARLRPETVNALLLWSATANAGTVALAPLSAALTEGRDPPGG